MHRKGTAVTRPDKDKTSITAGTISGISCTNLSQHNAQNQVINNENNNRVNSSFNELSKNKSAVSFNNYLSHNFKDKSNSHLPDDLSGPKSAILVGENISQCCIDDEDSNCDCGSNYYDEGNSQSVNNKRGHINNKSNSQLSINLEQVQINEQPSGGIPQQKYPTMPGSRSCVKSLSYPIKNHNDTDSQIMLNNCKAQQDSRMGQSITEQMNQSAINMSQAQDAAINPQG